MATPGETEISSLDTLVHSYEFENKNYMKMIEKENQTILELQAQSQQTTNEAKRLSLVIPQLEENIKHLDKQYISMLDNIDSQKKTRNLMADHELALTKQLEAMRISREEKSKFYNDQISTYTKVRDEYMEQYAKLSLAVQLNAKKSELSDINQKVTENQDKKREIKQLIQEKENYLDSHALHRIVVKIAETKLEITKLNEKITQIQADKTASGEFNKGSLPEKVNPSQQHFQDDNEDDDMNMEVDTNYSLSDMGTNYSLSDFHKQNIHGFNKISLDANTDSHDKVIPNKAFGASLCFKNKEDIETTVDNVESEDFSMTETESHAPSSSSKPEVKSTGFSTELPQGLSHWSQNNNAKCFPKPTEPSTLAASTTSAQFVPSFTLPSLPKLPTLMQFSKEQFITPHSLQLNQITSNTQGKSKNKFHFTSPQLPLKPMLQSKQLFRGFNEGQNSTASRFQNPTAYFEHNADSDSNVNDAPNFTSSRLQKSALSSLQKEQPTFNVNEARINSFHQFQKPTTSTIQSGQSKSEGIKNTTAFQFQKSVTSSSVMEESNQTIQEAKSATPFQSQKPSVHYGLPGSNSPPATPMTLDKFKASTPRFMLKPFQVPVAQLKPQTPSATGNNETMVKVNEYQRHVEVVKAEELPQTQSFQSAFPRVPIHIVAPAPTISTASEVPLNSIFKLNKQMNETATHAANEQSKQPNKSSTFSFLSLKISEDERTIELMPSPQNTTLEDKASNDGAGFLSSFNFDEQADGESDQTDPAEFSLTFESSKNNSSKSDSGAKPSSNQMFIFGQYYDNTSDTEDNEPPLFNTMSGNSHEPDQWANFSEADSPVPNATKLLFSDN